MAQVPEMQAAGGKGWVGNERSSMAALQSSGTAAQHWGGMGAAQTHEMHMAAGSAGDQGYITARDLESTVQALGGFIDDDMPTFSEFKKVRASRKGLLPS